MLATAEKPNGHRKANCHPSSDAPFRCPLTKDNLVAFEHQTSPNHQTVPKFSYYTNEESFKNAMKQSTESLGLELDDWIIEDMAQRNGSGPGLEAFLACHQRGKLPWSLI
jgi:hypothetical protein